MWIGGAILPVKFLKGETVITLFGSAAKFIRIEFCLSAKIRYIEKCTTSSKKYQQINKKPKSLLETTMLIRYF